MIIQPPLDKLMKKVDSRYSLVIATAKRARQLTDDPEKKSDKPVIDAVQDIINDRVTIDYSGEEVNNSDDEIISEPEADAEEISTEEQTEPENSDDSIEE